MKNILRNALLIFVAMFIIACSSNTPKDVAVGFLEEIYKDADASDALKYVDLKGASDDGKALLESKLKMAIVRCKIRLRKMAA